MGATFVAQVASHDLVQMTDLILQGLLHRGTSFINCLSPCVTYNAGMDKEFFKANSRPLPEGYDPSDFDAALKVVRQGTTEDYFPVGLIHKRDEPTLGDRAGEVSQKLEASASTSSTLTEIAARFM
jgi:2-oxoglutarate ferredoxin oxidoreductase subunit beta